MRKKNRNILFVILLLVIVAIFFVIRGQQSKSNNGSVKEIRPTIGSIQNIISTTGTILPKNRLEVKPPVNGRVDEILVQEGQKVKVGQVLAKMSSTERAALLDAARSKSEEDLKHWQEVYKAISLISPIDGDVIVAKTQNGQTVTTSDAIIVLSDQLIVRAQVDETDIGKIKLDQNALVSLDAYSDTKIKAKVGHLYYESKTVNNVTIYEVDLIPEEIPPFFRSGMNATIDFIEKSKDDVLLIPSESVIYEQDKTFVLVKNAAAKEPVLSEVTLGIADDRNVEVVSGIKESDEIIIKTTKYSLPKTDVGTNPFMPRRPQQRKANR